MAFKLAEAFTELTVRDSRFNAGMLKAKGMVTKLTASLNALKCVAMAALAGGLVYGLKKSFEASAEQEKAEAKLNQVIKATGQAAGYTAKELFDYADALQEVTTFSADEIKNGEAILASFVNIKGDLFKATAEMALNFSTFSGQDIQSSMLQLGKAMNDPIAGLGALTRNGVSFSNAEQEMIKTMAETNRLADAQRYILKAMNEQGMGNLARAQTESFTGKMMQLGNVLGDVGKNIAHVLSPQLGELVVYLRDVGTNTAQWLTDNMGELRAFMDGIKTLLSYLKDMAEIIITIAKYTPMGLLARGTGTLGATAQRAHFNATGGAGSRYQE